jgi:hypothetical protein
MPGTKRVPIRRHARPQTLTPEAITAYKVMKALACVCKPGDPPFSCRACEEWYRQLMVVHLELECRPWQIPCLLHPGEESDGSPNDELRRARTTALEVATKPRRGTPQPTP